MVTKVSGTEGVDLVKDGTLVVADAKAGQAVGFQKMQLFAAQATTSGTFKDFLGIPSWADKITVNLTDVGTSGTSFVQIQVGSGGVDNTNYASLSLIANATNNTSVGTTTTGAHIGIGTANWPRTGQVTFVRSEGNNWTWNGAVNVRNGNYYASTTGDKKGLTGALDTLRITTVNGTDQFNNGSISILVEGYE